MNDNHEPIKLTEEELQLILNERELKKKNYQENTATAITESGIDTTIKTVIPCLLCDSPLTDGGHWTLDGLHYCTMCRCCQSCHQLIPTIELAFIVRNQMDFRHTWCRLHSSTADELFQICCKDIEFLNRCLYLRADLTIDEPSQLKLMELKFHEPIWNEYTTHEQRFRHMRGIENMYRLCFIAVKALGEMPVEPVALSRKKIADEHSVKISKKIKETAEIKALTEQEQKDKKAADLLKAEQDIKESTPHGKAMVKFRQTMKKMNMTDELIIKQWNLMNEDIPWNL